MTDNRKGLLILTLDASASMRHLTKETISNVKQLLKDHLELVGSDKELDTLLCCITQFSGGFGSPSAFTCLLPLQAITQPLELDYKTEGFTPLYEGVCKTIDYVGSLLTDMKEEERPGQVNMFIITDGEENSSLGYTAADTKQRIERQTNQYSWNITFVGNSPDLTQAATQDLGVASTVQYTSTQEGIRAMYAAVSKSSTDLFKIKKA